MWFVGTITGGLLISWLLRDEPVISWSLLAFAIVLAVVLAIDPALGWWLLLIPVGCVALFLVWKALPFILGFVLGVAILMLLIMGLPEFLMSLGL